MKRKIVIFFLLCVATGLAGIGQVEAQGAGDAAMASSHAGNTSQQSPVQGKIFRSVQPLEAMRMLQARDDIVFLDVRTPQERLNGAIPGSKLVSFFDLVQGKVFLPKDKPIMLVCAVGGRSYVAAQVLSKKGYGEVYNVSGGIDAWYRAGLPVIRESPSSGQASR